MSIDEDETLETTRIPLRSLLEQGAEPPTGRLPARTMAAEAGEPGVSVTQAIRVRRGGRRRRRFTQGYESSISVSPWRDAAFPALISLLFTGRSAVAWASDGRVLEAIGLALGGILVTGAAVALISRTLDQR